MTDQSQLERRYRRLLACYPREFRREHGEEMLVVLLACAHSGRRRPALADSADLLRTALWMRLRPVTPRSVPSVFWAVRLLVVAAGLELVAMSVVIASQASVRAAVSRSLPHLEAAQAAAMLHGHVVSAEIGAPIAAVVWLALARANDRGRRWGRLGVPVAFGLTSVSLLAAVGQHVATYAPADLLAAIMLWLVAAAATLLVSATDSNRHYQRGGRAGRPRPAGSASAWRGGPDAATRN